MSMQLEEMEEELRDISAELAGSIRREMELEEEVERLQYDGPNALEKDKRTSDYYSDSGTSSVRDPDLPVNRTDDLEKLKRRSEQEKAQMKLDLSQKLQEERGRRKGLEDHIKNLEDHIRSVSEGLTRVFAVLTCVSWNRVSAEQAARAVSWNSKVPWKTTDEDFRKRESTRRILKISSALFRMISSNTRTKGTT